MNIWRVARDGDGWTEPEPMGPPVNSPESDIHIAASDSALWIPSRRAGTLGGSDLYRVPVGASEAQHVPAPLNDERSQPDLWISPDERWMILVVTDRPGGFGGDDLWVSRSDNGTWTVPENLGSIVNTEEYEYGPSLSRDGRHLYFTSHRSGSADVYRIPLAEVLGPDRRAVGR
jgi:hypothetical protein